MPIVRESITTVRSFDNAEKFPIGVGRLGLPIDAGIVRKTSPFCVTVKVCAEMLAVPTTASPVSKPVDSACTATPTWLCAGQSPSGFHSTTLGSGQSKRPVMWLGAVTWMVFSTAVRLVTGPGERDDHRVGHSDDGTAGRLDRRDAGLAAGGAIAAVHRGGRTRDGQHGGRCREPTRSNRCAHGVHPSETTQDPRLHSVSPICPTLRSANRACVARGAINTPSYRTYPLLSGLLSVGRPMPNP